MSYIPAPIDTASIELPDDLIKLTECLAKHAHDVWAKQRLLDGWRHGALRDDIKKEHPCLVAYEELPESEKQYDRNAAIETLKVILSMGFVIQAPETLVSAL